MKKSRNMQQQDQQQNIDDQSSNLDYLIDNQENLYSNLKGDDEQIKRKHYDSNQKQSEVQKIYINNLIRDRKIQNGNSFEGIYLYKPGIELPSLYQFANQTIRIIIATQYIKHQNPQISKRNIYGTDPYTSNSDAVCILIHSGSINLNTYSAKKYEGIQLTCKVIKPKKNYAGSFKNGILSRNLKGYNGNALKPQSVRNLTSLGPMQYLERYAANMHIPIGKTRIKPKPKNLKQMFTNPQTHIVFNMNNQPAYKYSIFNIADKGFDKNEYMIKKLERFVLYIQTENRNKYQLTKKIQLDVFDVFRFARLKTPETADNQYFSMNSSPLNEDDLEILYHNLEWDQIIWGNNSILLKKQTKIDNIKSFKYYNKQKSNK